MQTNVFKLTLLLALASSAAYAQEDLPTAAKGVLTKYCAECHTATGDGGIDYITNLGKLVERKKVIPAQVGQSQILRRMEEENPDAKMPPPYASLPDVAPEDLAIIKKWIESGAKDVAEDGGSNEGERSAISIQIKLESIRRFLKRLPKDDRQFQRFFTLDHLHNLPSGEFSAAQLRSVRAATSKVLNSLSWKPDMVLPKPIDEAETILAFDLRDMDWDASHSATQIDFWQYLIDGYPYGVSYETNPSEEVQELAVEVYKMTGTNLPMVRADWFVSTASRPPYYHLLLYDLVLPNVVRRQRVEVDDPEGGKFTEYNMTAKDLESFLRVDVLSNIARARVARSAFSKSGVSSGSRLLERHSALFGAYWKSYDFTRQNIDQDVLRKPFGPLGASHLPNAAKREFRHDGGEIIFNLPNGLQGYLLVDAKDNRLAFGPPSLVSDGSRALGNAQIVNGISCMYCHSQGMIKGGFRDEVRLGAAGLSTEELAVMKRIYLDPADFDALLDRDEQRYKRALEACEKDYYPPQPKYTAGQHEPIKAVAQRFVTQDLALVDLAAELDISSDALKAKIESSDVLRRRLGLAGVAAGGRIKRAAWEKGTALSTYQQTVLELQIGSPVNNRVTK